VAVRIGQIVLFMAASRDDPALRSSVIGLAVSTAIGRSESAPTHPPGSQCH